MMQTDVPAQVAFERVLPLLSAHLLLCHTCLGDSFALAPRGLLARCMRNCIPVFLSGQFGANQQMVLRLISKSR